MRVPLRKLAYARSGDKGASANIGVIAYSGESYAFLEDTLTAEKVKDYFKALNPISVTRYKLPNLHAFNFVLKGILAEGGSRSLRFDAQGKALGQTLLNMELEL